MDAQGVTGDLAEAMYLRARNERVAILRAEGFRRMKQGVLLLVAGAGLYAFFHYFVRHVPKTILGFSGVGMLWGFRRIVDGLTGVVMAPHREGSVADGA